MKYLNITKKLEEKIKDFIEQSLNSGEYNGSTNDNIFTFTTDNKITFSFYFKDDNGNAQQFLEFKNKNKYEIFKDKLDINLREKNIKTIQKIILGLN